MKRIYSEPNPIFIYQLRDLLNEKGIKSIIRNEYLSGGVGELPPTEVWPELWVVDKEDKEPAAKVVNEFLKSIKSKPNNWICNDCGQEIEGQFNICWSCGSENSES